MLSDRSFLRFAVTGASLAIGLSFGLAVAVVNAAEPPLFPPSFGAAAGSQASIPDPPPGAAHGPGRSGRHGPRNGLQ